MTKRLFAKVYFIGAGPGDPELVTVKGQRIISQADIVIYAGSLVPQEIVAQAKPSAKVYNSASLNLSETHELCRDGVKNGLSVARVHTGDPALYGAIAEQINLLEEDGIEHETIPGVSVAFAAAAVASVSFTKPELSQSLIITRISGRTPVPEKESIASFCAHKCAMAIYLSTEHIERLAEELSSLEPHTCIICAHKVGFKDEKIVKTDLENLVATVKEHGFSRQTVFLVLPFENDEANKIVSKLYDKDFSHMFRA